MLETKADFRRKDIAIEAADCVVEKIIRLSGAEFDRFSRNLMREYDFLRDNKIDSVIDDKGRIRCLLVTGEGRRDGILVNTEGSDYARCSAFMPNINDFLTVGRYSALAKLNKKLTAMVDYIAEVGGTGNPEGRGVIDLLDEAVSFGIDFMTNGALRSTVLTMLNERPEIRDWELDGSQLIVYRKLPGNDTKAMNFNGRTSVIDQIKASRAAKSKGKPQDMDTQNTKKQKRGAEL